MCYYYYLRVAGKAIEPLELPPGVREELVPSHGTRSGKRKNEITLILMTLRGPFQLYVHRLCVCPPWVWGQWK